MATSLWKEVENTFGVLKTDTLQSAVNLIRGINALTCGMGYPELRESCETMETEEREDKNMSIDEKLIKIFEYALQQEETGKSFFQNSLQRMGWGSAVSAFKKLIEEEDHHILLIKKILGNLRQGRPLELAPEKGLSLEPTNYFDERAKSELKSPGCHDGSADLAESHPVSPARTIQDKALHLSVRKTFRRHSERTAMKMSP